MAFQPTLEMLIVLAPIAWLEGLLLLGVAVICNQLIAPSVAFLHRKSSLNV
ncbi:hypothetical protein [Helicobacter felis]|uniref:hypothetical protein n=1 Tax=Helicobacter felis TaxID=214 RepID=UPI0013152B8C|nr:hypothetical protein [Helicobacter felis]